MAHRPNRQRAIAIAAPVPYAGPGHLVIIAALVVLALLIFGNLTMARAGLFGGPAEVKAQAGTVTIPVADVSDGKAHYPPLPKTPPLQVDELAELIKQA